MDDARIQAVRTERAAILQRAEDHPTRAERLAAVDAELARLGDRPQPEPAGDDAADHTPRERAVPRRGGRRGGN